MKKHRVFFNKKTVKNRRLHASDGFTLIEMMIGICVLSVGLLAIGTMQVSSLKGVGSARNQTEAIIWAQAVIEELMLLDSSDNANLSIGTHPQEDNPVVTAHVDALAAGYSSAWDVADAAEPNALSIVATVSWSDKSGARMVQLVNVKPNI